MTGLGDPFFSALLPPRVVWRSRLLDPAQPALPLHADELAAVAHAVPKRQREFAAGRQCAREALAALCGYSGAVPVGLQRAPVWPDGVVGSISHDDGCCVAAVALRSDLAGLGIDIECIARLSSEHEATICTAAERARLPGAPGSRARSEQLALVFCAKEAFYKAQFPLTGAWLDFADVEIALPRGPGGEFTATLWRAAGGWPAGSSFSGSCGVDGPRAAAVLALRAGPPG